MGKEQNHHYEEGYYDGGHVSSGFYASQPPPPLPPPIPDQWTPWLVNLIFFVDVGIFLYVMYVDDCPATYKQPDQCLFRQYLGRFSFLPLQKNPLLGPSTETLQNLGGLRVELVQHGESWRLFSCLWLHAGAIHLLSNMLSLLFIGNPLEREFGFFKVLPLYVLSGIGGSLVSCINIIYGKDKSSYVSVGASGSLFGLLGAMLSELITNWSIYANKCGALSGLVIVISLNMAFGLIPGVDNSAHMGGFASGFFLGFVLLVRPQFGYVSSRYIHQGYNVGHKKSKYKIYQYVLFGISLVLLIFGYSYATVKVLSPEAVQVGDGKMKNNMR